MTLKEWLKREGMVRRALAERLKVSTTTVTLLVHGKRTPSMALAHKIELETKGKVKIAEWAKANGVGRSRETC